jgi:hypothetical protein
MKREWIRPLFRAAALYDILLGLGYGLGFKTLFKMFAITLPNHDAYVHLPAALILILGVGFWFVAQAPERNRDIIRLGVMMKLAFSIIVFGHLLLGAIPTMWVPFAVIDLLFMISFLMALRALPKPLA